MPALSSRFTASDKGTDIRSIPTTDTGNFNITNLPAGRYTVTVTGNGFETFVARDVVLNVAEKHTLDVQLQTGKASVTVEVTAENTPIQTTTAEESGTVTGEQSSWPGAEQSQLRTTLSCCNPVCRINLATNPDSASAAIP